MGLWNEFGFRDNPYSTKAIPPTAEGVELLVGRNSELRRLRRLITSSDTHPTVEGSNGVGKTSLVQVTAYREMRSAQRGTTDQVHIPLPDIFQVTGDEKPAEFVRRVCLGVARGFRTHRDVLRDLNRDVPDQRAIDRWINQPLFHSNSLSTPVGGVGRATMPNTSSGFSEDGLVRTVFDWLETCFPSGQSGGFVCVLDNMELLEKSSSARKFLEGLRDSIFTAPGLRWVLCGARGVVRSVVSSPRLNGVLGTPLELEAVTPALAREVVARRINIYALANDPFLPVDPDGFAYVYEHVNENLRDSLKLCESFALEFDGRPRRDPSREQLEVLLKKWLDGEGSKYRDAAQALQVKTWDVFENLVANGGQCTTADYAEFGFSSMDAFRVQLRKLGEKNLVVFQTDHNDQRRHLVSVSTNGWLVRHSSGSVRSG